jgi:transmembrane sensor
MKKADFQDIVNKYLSGNASEAERRLLEEYYRRLSASPTPLPAEGEERLRTEMLQAIFDKAGIPRAKVVSFHRRWMKYAAAVAVLGAVAVGTYLYRKSPVTETRMVAQPIARQDVAAPTGSHTTLTLSNGQRIVLDSVAAGALAEQGGARVNKTGNGQLAYHIAIKKPAEILYNTLATAKGGQTHVTLADGSQVWLNAASSLRFPTAFTGTVRSVELTGEAYFEITPNAKQPFTVTVGAETVQVLGTHFNIMAYADESSLQTTLLEGSVKVVSPEQTRILNPGQQAQIGEGKMRVISDIDPEEVLAWKNGLFQFNSLDIQAVMRQVSRWYDVDVVYSGKPPTDTFSGIVSRTSNASDVLKIIEQANIHVKIENKTITILP